MRAGTFKYIQYIQNLKIATNFLLHRALLLLGNVIMRGRNCTHQPGAVSDSDQEITLPDYRLAPSLWGAQLGPNLGSLGNYNNNKHLRCGNRKGLLGRTDQTHHRMDPNHQLKQY